MELRNRVYRAAFCLLCVLVMGLNYASSSVADEFVPRRQSKLPGPPLSPQEALKKMVVPKGFEVELVASEPQIMNPVAMCFDEKGRIWVTESFEYPRKAPGKGRDRIKVLEDTDNDGKVDKVTVFAEGLNIPSGIAVGRGGVWVANAPDILFMQDTDGDLKVDKTEVVVTGFGRDDTHELPNALTWGPDGYLYGLNGVFNRSVVKHRGKTYDFTCAMFRIDPRRGKDGKFGFEVFAEGTSNPWGIAFNPNGEAFISACVIDHLWHITETGYYHRQGGPYPPYTWKLGSIVKHKHQMAAYCGIVYMDSPAFPKEWNERLFMGNIHGGCINVDYLERDGSTYFAKPNKDFMTANDVWFMPVAQKVGPDGSLYVLDWYDRYHCYQDANRDPKGIDRGHGRLYRVRYKGTPRAKPFDLSKESDSRLIERLADRNVYYRDMAQRILMHRRSPAAASELSRIAREGGSSPKQRMHAMWALVGMNALNEELHLALLGDKNDVVRAWAVRAAGNFGAVSKKVREKVVSMVGDSAADVRLQVAIASRKVEGVKSSEVLADVLANSPEDKIIPNIVWQNLHPLLETQPEAFVNYVSKKDLSKSKALAQLMPRVAGRILGAKKVQPEVLAQLIALLLDQNQIGPAERTLGALSARVQTGEIAGATLKSIQGVLSERLKPLVKKADGSSLSTQAALLSVTWGDTDGLKQVKQIYLSPTRSDALRVDALRALIAAKEKSVLDSAERVLREKKSSAALRRSTLHTLGQLNDAKVSKVLLGVYGVMPEDLKPVVIEILTQRGNWTQDLLQAIKQEKVSRDVLNLNQVRNMYASGDEGLKEIVESVWGKIREGRNPNREKVIASVRQLLRKHKGDPVKGQAVFAQVCAQCHQIYGKGQAIGPDLTSNGRGSFDQLLSNVLDPNLVIGDAYQLRIVETKDGRTLAGMMAENNDQRIVIKMLGGKTETVPRNQVKKITTSPISFMPEGLEASVPEQDLIDLFYFLMLDKEPSDPDAQWISGAGSIDVSRLHIPKSVDNLLVSAKATANVYKFDEKGVRGGPRQMIYDTRKRGFVVPTQWHETGVGYNKNIGVVKESDPVFWEAEWKEPVQVNFMSFSGTYENQRQQKTAWKIEVRQNGKWNVIEQGVGGWYDNGRYVWGGAGYPPIMIDAVRVSLFSSDAKTPLVSVHFRGEPYVSYVVANVKEGTPLELDFRPGDATNPSDYPEVLKQIAPGFSTKQVGLDGAGLLAEHRGRTKVLRIHPVNRETPCILSRKVDVPKEGKTFLVLDVSCHEQGDWRMIVKADGKQIHESIQGNTRLQNGWRTMRINLSAFAGKTIDLDIENHANDWMYEYAYLRDIRIVTSK